MKTVVIALLLLLAAGGAAASTILVRQDGSGDHTTLQAAVAVAAAGDLILVGPGVYTPGFMHITTSNLTFRSEAGAAATTLDGLDTSRLFWFDGAWSGYAQNCAVEGFTLRRGWMPTENGEGCGIIAWQGATVAVSDCIFEDNWAGLSSAAIFARDAGTSVAISDCVFRRNVAEKSAGAVGVAYDAFMSIANSTFDDNSAYISGAVTANRATLNLSGCVFLRNEGEGAGAVHFYLADGSVTNNTFHANRCNDNGTVVLEPMSFVAFIGNIVTSEGIGAGLTVFGGNVQHDCNIYFDTPLGAIDGDVLGPNEYEVDPMYCCHPADDLTLCSMSLALPQNNGCGLMGAFGQGCDACGPIGIRDETWGGMKGMYR